ncbi:hypothetical protein GQ600_22913 [Phytophthora cactorum]|nr:hypothetical protein GQ600_22913 [Phytophthora cactorum]
MVGEENNASGLRVSIMPVIDTCIESILSSADNILLEESLSRSLRPKHSNNEQSLVQTIDV